MQRVMMLAPIRMSVPLLVQENERVKVRLREGTFVQGCNYFWQYLLLRFGWSSRPSRKIQMECDHDHESKQVKACME